MTDKIIRAVLAQKLHPDNFKTGGKLQALLAVLLGQEWTKPNIGELTITSDGFMIADGGFLGDAIDLIDNLYRMKAQKLLTKEELAYLLRCVQKYSPYGWKAVKSIS